MIAEGYNVKNNCVYYMKNRLHSQLKDIRTLHSTLEKELDVLITTSDSLNNTIDNVSNSSEHSNQTLKTLISDLNSMSAVVTNFQDYFNSVDVSEITSDDIDNVINLFGKLESIFNDSFLSRLESNIQDDNETMTAIHNLDEQSKQLGSVITEIRSQFAESK
jgi:methyl-accepting chemotaxis protein